MTLREWMTDSLSQSWPYRPMTPKGHRLHSVFHFPTTLEVVQVRKIKSINALTTSLKLTHISHHRYDYRCLSRPLAQVRTLLAKI